MNKKLIKTFACIACGTGIVSTIPFISTSCGSNQVVENVLKYSGNEESKNLPTIHYNSQPRSCSTTGTFSIENPDNFSSYKFNVFQLQNGKYVPFNPQGWLGIKINQDNQLEISDDKLQSNDYKIEVYCTLKNGNISNTISGFTINTFC